MPTVNISPASPAGSVPPLSPVQASACTCFKLRSLARRVTQLYDQALAPAGLTVTQFSVIGHARRRDGAAAPTVSELAQALAADRTTLTRNLKPLVDKGFLKVGSGADARSKAVCVTSEGETVYQAARPMWKLAQARVRDLAGAAQLNQLHDLIETILPKLDESGEGAH